MIGMYIKKFLAAARVLAAACVVAGVTGGFAVAQQPGGTPDRQEQIAKEIEDAYAAARDVAKHGPAVVELGSQGSMTVPENEVYIPEPQAGRILRAMGNSTAPDLVGILLPTAEGEQWLAAIRYIKSGYIRDKEAASWDTDELLQNLKSGTEAGNADRRARGFPALEVIGWVQKPSYNAADHRLVWSVNAREVGSSKAEDSINYNTYALGREGYFSLNFVTDLGSIEREKPIANALLNGIEYAPGKRYADYNSATDHVAEYGIAALVAGGVAKKLGFFALFGAFFLKAGKLLIIPLIAGAALLRRFFGSRA